MVIILAVMISTAAIGVIESTVPYYLFRFNYTRDFLVVGMIFFFFFLIFLEKKRKKKKKKDVQLQFMN